MPLQFLEIGFHVEIHAIEWHDFQHETQFHGVVAAWIEFSLKFNSIRWKKKRKRDSTCKCFLNETNFIHRKTSITELYFSVEEQWRQNVTRVKPNIHCISSLAIFRCFVPIFIRKKFLSCHIPPCIATFLWHNSCTTRKIILFTGIFMFSKSKHNNQ